MNIVFTRTAWDQYTSWQDRKIVRRINELIKDIQRNGNEGIGKPELLRGELSGFAARRIDQEHRLVYSIDGDKVQIISCRGHYS